MAKAYYKILQLREEHVKERFLSYRELLREGFDFDQREKPANYCGHSLSVSDVVYIRQGGEGGLYYVDAIGFRKLEEDEVE